MYRIGFANPNDCKSRFITILLPPLELPLNRLDRLKDSLFVFISTIPV